MRQFPGNGADLDFRGVLAGCTAAIVAAAPIDGRLWKCNPDDREGGMRWPDNKEVFLKSDEYAAAAKVLPFCRLWYVQNTRRPGGFFLPPR